MKKYLNGVSRNAWILIIIVGLGLFLRAYHFQDWLQFSPDQARDALIVGDALEGVAPLPLAGPQAGNTAFSIGPLYYEAQYFSAKIFGNTPQAMAYPDLFFSVLTIPLLYIFLKKYFIAEISLVMTALFSVSYFAIVNSRFASNPNSIPFFVLLFFYALLEIMQKQENKRKLFFWYAVVGFAMGVGIQLHTILVFTMPGLLLFATIWLWKEKLFSWKGFVWLVIAFLVINTGQIVYELRTGGGNTKALISSVISRSDSGNDLARNISIIASCQLESNIHFISSLENNKDCGELFTLKGTSKKKNLSAFAIIQKNRIKILAIIVGIIFTIGGYIFLWRLFREEKDVEKRNFIWLLAFYNLISLIVLIPVATEVELRYFNVMNMLPFVLLGAWLVMLLRGKRAGKIGSIALIAVVLLANIYVDARFAVRYVQGQMSNDRNSMLGEIEPVARYILNNKGASQQVALVGGRKYTKRFYKPLYYLLKKDNVELKNEIDKNSAVAGARIFHIDKNLGSKYGIGKKMGDFTIADIFALNDSVKVYLLIK